jgi:hypothetical protein
MKHCLATIATAFARILHTLFDDYDQRLCSRTGRSPASAGLTLTAISGLASPASQSGRWDWAGELKMASQLSSSPVQTCRRAAVRGLDASAPLLQRTQSVGVAHHAPAQPLDADFLQQRPDHHATRRGTQLHAEVVVRDSEIIDRVPGRRRLEGGPLDGALEMVLPAPA